MKRIPFWKHIVSSLPLAFCLIGCWGDYEAGETVYPAAIDAGDSAAIRAILDSNGLENVTVRKVIDQYSKGRINFLTLNSLGLDSFTFTSDFNKLDSIYTVGLSFNSIVRINVSDSPKLSHIGIILNSNLLDSFPLSLLKIKSNGVIGVEVEHNSISSIPLQLLGANITLDCYYNKLCNVPDTIAHWLDGQTYNWRNFQTCP